MSHRLITVPFSHFCEKARWALDRARVPYTEERHLPMLHWAATFAAGGGRTVPVLVAGDRTVVADSTDILRWTDRYVADGARLYPDDAATRATVDALEDEFDEQLGPATRRVGYHYAFGDSRIVLELARRAEAGWEFHVVRAGLPLLRALMLRAMRIDERTVALSLDLTRAIFDRVAEILRDGRRYLAGGRFSAADLTFAALGGPMVVPPEHPVALPVDLLPAAAHRLRDELRVHPAGMFIMRLYAEHRGRPA
jgi:glutathione S-transferase